MAEIAPLRSGDPERLGAYRLTGLLGEGGQGSVYLAEDDGGRRVAVKLLHARFTGDAKARSRFAAELAVARRVSPFCTARILDADVEGDRPYIVSEYIDGPSLSEVLAAQGPRAGGDLDRLAIGTMTALAAIHQAGVVHRDFKPANVLVAPDGPRVIDFGIARALDATGTLSSTAVGTPAYMAPEQITGARIGPQADVWAWGATMVFAATGRVAFGQDTIPAVMHRILNLPPDLGVLTEPLRGLVARCLTKDPSARPSSQQVLVQLLTLAGSLPQPTGQGTMAQPSIDQGTVLNQGAKAAAGATRLGRPHPAPPFAPGAPQPAGPTPFPAPPPPTTPTSGTPIPGTQTPGAAAPASVHPPGFSPDGRSSTAGPTIPGGEWAQPPTMPGRPKRRRGMGVLAGGVGAALVALVIGAGVAMAQLGDGDTEPQTPKQGGTIRLALGKTTSVENAVDPSHAANGIERFLAKQMFTGLTELTPDGTVRPRLAQSLTPDAECRSWRIEIRPGTTFSNGEPVNAEAFARGWLRTVQSPYSRSALMHQVRGYPEASKGRTPPKVFPGVRVTGGNVLQVDLEHPDCEFDKRLADPVFSPAPANAGTWENYSYNRNPIGNGPFKLRSYRPGDSMVLVRNDRWAFGRTPLDEVEIQFVPDSGQRSAFFATRQVDWAAVDASGSLAPSQRGVVRRDGSGQLLLVPITTRGPMRTREARLAVSYALDRRQIADSLPQSGHYRPASALVPPTVPGFGRAGTCPSCDRPDPARARQLAESADLAQGTKVDFYLPRGYETFAFAIERQLEQVLGWQVTLRPLKSVLTQEINPVVAADDASGLVLLGWQPDHPSPYPVLVPLLMSDQVATPDNDLTNYAGWRDPTFDSMMQTASRTRDARSRDTIFHQAERRALDDMAVIPLWTRINTALASDTYTALTLDEEGFPTVATAVRK